MGISFRMCLASVPLFLSLSSPGESAAPWSRSVNDLWFVEKVEGRWEIKEEGQRPRPMGQKEVLTPTCQIRCLAAPCALLYEDSGLKALPAAKTARTRLREWVRVPTRPALAAGAGRAELAALTSKVGVRGGVAKASPACAGELPVLAPACGETIDVSDFAVKWTPRPSEAGKLLTLLVGGSDSSERRRWSVNADAGEFRAKALDDYLVSLQLPDRGTDVTIRLMRTETVDAVRLVRLLSRAEDADHRRRIAAIALLPELSQHVLLLSHLLDRGMMSRAADVSRQLLHDAPGNLEVRTLALAGLCGSGFADEIAALRNSLRSAGVTGVCEPEGMTR